MTLELGRNHTPMQAELLAALVKEKISKIKDSGMERTQEVQRSCSNGDLGFDPAAIQCEFGMWPWDFYCLLK